MFTCKHLKADQIIFSIGLKRHWVFFSIKYSLLAFWSMTVNTCQGTQTGTLALAEKDNTFLTTKELKKTEQKTVQGDKEMQNRHSGSGYY